jgi:cob(I)alamin adenosyltransferase
MKIYTKKGDDGGTGLFDGTRVKKNNLRIETYGTVDELNSVIGVAIATCKHEVLANALSEMQKELFLFGADLATPLGGKNETKIERIGESHVANLEKVIDQATAELPPLKRFILPGGGVTAAHLHVARTVCRRAERLLVLLMEKENVGDQPLIYLNRLSDLLFTLARLANKLDGLADVEW